MALGRCVDATTSFLSLGAHQCLPARRGPGCRTPRRKKAREKRAWIWLGDEDLNLG